MTDYRVKLCCSCHVKQRSLTAGVCVCALRALSAYVKELQFNKNHVCKTVKSVNSFVFSLSHSKPVSVVCRCSLIHCVFLSLFKRTASQTEREMPYKKRNTVATVDTAEKCLAGDAVVASVVFLVHLWSVCFRMCHRMCLRETNQNNIK